MKSDVLKWFKENSMIVFLISLVFLIPIVLRMIDSTAAAFDPGILHSVVIVCVSFAIFQACTWSVVKFIWPDIGNYFKNSFSQDFWTLDNRYKVLIALVVYFAVLGSFILLTCAYV